MSDPQYVVSVDRFNGRNDVVDERFARDKDLLDRHGTTISLLEKMTLQLGEMIKRHDDILDSQGVRIDKIDNRVTLIEQKPMESLGKFKSAFIGSLAGLIASGLGAAVIHYISTMQT